MENEARQNLVSKKQKLQNDLFKRLGEFEQETGLSVKKIRFLRDDNSGLTNPPLTGVRMKIELVWD
jgi:hypothetical protein